MHFLCERQSLGLRGEIRSILYMKKVKKILAAILICIMCVGGLAETASAANVSQVFTDVPAGSWYAEPVQYVYDRGIMTGMSANRFGSDVKISRAQFAVILYRMEGEPYVEAKATFSDVPGGTWFTNAVLWANENKIATGYQNGKFGPSDPITREQMALMMERYAQYKGYDTPEDASLSAFSDNVSVSAFAIYAMKWAVGKGIITGKQNGTKIDPQGKASRAECAMIIMRFMNTYAEAYRGECAFYQKLLAGQPVKILIVGDSIGAYAGCSSKETHWGTLMVNWLKSQYGANVTLDNVSVGGTTSYAGYVNVMKKDGSENYDLVVVCYGQNDANEQFEMYYESLLRAIMHRFSESAIISILESSQREYTQKMRTIKAVCANYHILVADTIAAFNNSGIAYNVLAADGIHPSDPGQKLYFETMKKVISGAVNRGNTKMTMTAPFYPGVDALENCAWYSADGDFTRVDSTTYVLKAAISGRLGIDYTYKNGNSNGKFFIDGKQISSPALQLKGVTKKRHIIEVTSSCTIKNELKIKFDDAEQAEGFYGIAISW